VSARWIANGSLAFATKTRLYIADEPRWTVREVSLTKTEAMPGGAMLRLLASGYVDDHPDSKTGMATVYDYAGKAIASVEPVAFVFPSTRRKALTKCAADGKRCKTTLSERSGSEWKPSHTFDTADDLETSESSPQEDFYVRGLDSDALEVIALGGRAPAVRVATPHNNKLSTAPPDAAGAVKASRTAPLLIPNGIIATDFERSTQRLLFQTQAGLALFDVASDTLLGI
jgi:hypothetical protein